MSYDFQDYPDFVAPFTKSIKLLAQSLHLVGHFPWVLSILQSLPDSVVGVLNPAMVPVFQFQKVSAPHFPNQSSKSSSLILWLCQEITAQIKRIVREEADGKKQTATDHKTVFSEMLKSDLPQEELSVDRLKHEALSITGGGVDTIKNALVTASYGIISDPAIYKRLHEELVQAMPTGEPLTVPEFEKLPYLNAIVQECKSIHTHTPPIQSPDKQTAPPKTTFDPILILLYTTQPSAFPTA